MYIKQIFELSMELDNEKFNEVLENIFGKSDYCSENEDGYIDGSIASKGILVICRDSRYRKKIKLAVNPFVIDGDSPDGDRLIRKLDKRIGEYFNRKYRLDDFLLSGVRFITDIDVGNRENVSSYMKILHRIGRVKGFSASKRKYFDEDISFCLSGNSNGIDFLVYDLEKAVMRQGKNGNTSRKQWESVSRKAKGILRAEVRLLKQKAIRRYTNAFDVSGQIAEISKKRKIVFLETFMRIVPFGDHYKKDRAAEILKEEVEDGVMRRKMLRLLALIPIKKSLYLAQKEMDCRNMEEVMEMFAKINLSPVTISKRQDLKCLRNLYDYL